LVFDDHGGVPLTVTLDSVTHVAGTNSAILNLTVVGIPSGVETIEVRPANGSTIYNSGNNAMPDSSTTGQILLNPPCNNNNTLATLTTDSGTWDAPYAIATTAYTIDVPATETDLVMDAGAVAPMSTIAITDPNGTTNGTGTASRTVTLNPAGMTTMVSVQVTSECGTAGTVYSITVQRSDPDVSLSGGGTYAENVGTVDLTVSLSAVSGLPVTVDLGYSGTLSTPGDYSTSHPISISIPAGNLTGTVTLTIIDDAIDEPSESVVVDITGITNGMDPAPAEQQVVSVTDNDLAGVTVNPTTADVTEGGATDKFDVVLNTQPIGDVVIDIANTADATVDFNTLTFTTLNWNVPQTVTVTATDDAIQETSPESTTLVIAVNAGSTLDPVYDAINPDDVVVSVTDNDSAGVTVSPTTADVTEGGATDTFDVVLGTQPTSDVVIDIANTADATVDFNTLTFTSLNWNVPQTVTVTATDDLIQETSPESTTLVVAVNAGSTLDPVYDAINPDDVLVSVT
ncbi:MAG: Calx-beta domain-containing protein, partial [candidate division Zixibacteria bacterium]|nr:Calx-beta domain-containing protein [candidate division Zixibacteria bacterium]